MSKRILIITNRLDVHADLIVPVLTAKGHAPFRIDLDAFPRDYQTSQAWAAGQCRNRIRLLPDGEWLDMERVGAVWVRKTAEFSYLSELSAQERAFAAMESEQALSGLLYSLDAYWMSHPLAVRGAQWKGEQLARAARMGFRVPASLITNCPAQVRAFADAVPGPIIFKAMSSPALAADRLDPKERSAAGLATTIVDDAMMAALDAVRELACHFQEYIEKQYELRVTVIGKRLFAARIHSQDDPRTVVDSRDMSAPIRYEACVLPPEVARRCLDYVHSYGLNYGALDLIVTPAGDYVFLENNPAGQFYYVEQLIPEFKMLEAVADTLIEESTWRS